MEAVPGRRDEEVPRRDLPAVRRHACRHQAGPVRGALVDRALEDEGALQLSEGDGPGGGGYSMIHGNVVGEPVEGLTPALCRANSATSLKMGAAMVPPKKPEVGLYTTTATA